MKRIRILLADDHLPVRAQVFARLVREPDFEIVAVADNSGQAVEWALKTKPEIVVIDPVMRAGLGIQAICSIAAKLSNTAVIVLTACLDTAQRMELEKAGVRRILNKGIASCEFVEILREIGTRAAEELTIEHGAISRGKPVVVNF